MRGNISGYAAAVDKVGEYFYDYQNRWVRKALDSDGDGHLDGRRIFLYDGNQIVMDFQQANSQDMQIGHLRERHLWGPAVDQILGITVDQILAIRRIPVPLETGQAEGPPAFADRPPLG